MLRLLTFLLATITGHFPAHAGEKIIPSGFFNYDNHRAGRINAAFAVQTTPKASGRKGIYPVKQAPGISSEHTLTISSIKRQLVF